MLVFNVYLILRLINVARNAIKKLIEIYCALLLVLTPYEGRVNL
jgi:hypothetical protein